MKRIIALIIVFVMAISLSACNVKEVVSENLPPQGYYFDEDGIQHEVYVDSEGVYFYTDEEGNRQEVKEEEVIKQVEMIESGKQELEMTDDLVTDEMVTDKTTEGEAEAQQRMKTYTELLSTNKYTISGTIKQKDTDVQEFPLLYIRNDSDFFIEAEVPFEKGKAIKASIVYLDGTAYCAIPSMKLYYVLDESEDVGDDFGTGTFDDETIKKYVFVESGTVTVNGKSYICDVYDYEGETHKYYYDSDSKLIRIEEIKSEKSYTILEIKGMSSKVDTSKIKKPTGVNVTDMM